MSTKNRKYLQFLNIFRVFPLTGDFLFPRRCVLCEQYFAKKESVAICKDCFMAIRSLCIERHICQQCGCLLAFPDSKLCHRCRDQPAFYFSARSAFLFASPIKGLIHKVKFGGDKMLCADLGKLMADRLPAYSKESLVTWVPLAKKRYAIRGFNQARILAEAFARQRGLMSVAMLRRVRYTDAQALLGRAARLTNMSGVFSCLEKKQFVGKRVLLVDDVFTTGATAAACSRVLKESGARCVHVCTLAHG